MAKRQTLYEILTDAINDLAKHGYDSQERIAFWSEKLRKAAEDTANFGSMGKGAREAFEAIYRRLVQDRGALKLHPGVSRFTLEKVAPQLRAELDRRIMASANLIRLNRTEAIQKTLQRFQGWATSIPVGGTKSAERVETKASIGKALKDLPFAERRVLIDQGHKLTASISEVVATGGGAIALIWRSHWRQKGYNYRPDHKERDGKVYLLRDNWAIKAGLVKVGDAGWYDQVTAVAQEPFCRCQAQYLYNMRDLPDDMLTATGRDELDRVRVK